MPVRYGEVETVSVASASASVFIRRPDAAASSAFVLYDDAGSGALTQGELLYRSAALALLTRASADKLIVRVFLDDKQKDRIVQVDLVRELAADDDASTEVLLAPAKQKKKPKEIDPDLHLQQGPP